MGGIYVGEEHCIELEDGVRAYIYSDLPQGVDDDLQAHDRAMGGVIDPTTRNIWPSKLVELSVLRLVHPGGQEEQLTPEAMRRMKADVVDQLFREIMALYFPLAYKDLQEILGETQEDSGQSLITSEASANGHPNGSTE